MIRLGGMCSFISVLWDIIVLPLLSKPGFCCILGIISHILLVICIFILSFIESHILCNHPVVFFCGTCAVNQLDSVGSLISICKWQLGFNIYYIYIFSALRAQNLLCIITCGLLMQDIKNICATLIHTKLQIGSVIRGSTSCTLFALGVLLHPLLGRFATIIHSSTFDRFCLLSIT